MNITAARLKQIIVEEYIKEELLTDSQAAEDLLKQILGDEEYERRQALKNRGSRGGDTAPMEKPHQAASTMAIDTGEVPQSSGTESLEDEISSMIKGMPPEDVQDLFQAVFAKIPGVQMGADEEEPPESLYSPGAEGRPQVGFKLEELQELIRRVLRDV